MSRRAHLRAWAMEVLRDGFARGTVLKTDAPEATIKWLLAQAAADLRTDLTAILSEIGLGLAEAGLRVAHRKGGEVLDELLGVLSGKLRGARR